MNILNIFDLHVYNYMYTFAVCFLLHIIADFNLQGILGNLKQKDWWKENYPQELYKEDWRISLIIHSLFWSIFTFLPLFVTIYTSEHELAIYITYVLTIIINITIHAFVDDIKANKMKISLAFDQIIHFFQIAVTVVVWYFLSIKII